MVAPVLVPEVESPLSAGLPALAAPELFSVWVESPLVVLPDPYVGSPAIVDVHAQSPTSRQRWVMFGASAQRLTRATERRKDERCESKVLPSPILAERSRSRVTTVAHTDAPFLGHP